MRKKIAIDINDVLRDNLTQFINYYTRFEDNFFDLKREDITSFDFEDFFKFESHDDYMQFKYVDYAYELFARAEMMDENNSRKLNDWMQNTLRDVDEENIPDVMFVSPFEYTLTIQATYAFLARIGTRVREMYFPVDSSTIWDKCDILITANPNLIKSVPEGKIVIKIDAPYNKEIDSKFSFNSLNELINDENNTIIKILEDNY